MKAFTILGSAVLTAVIAMGGVSARDGMATAGKYKPVTARGQAAGQIISKWSGYVAEVYGTAPMTWSKAMAASFAQADVRNMQRASKMKTFEGMMSVLMGQRASDAKIIDKLARSSGSLSVVQALGSPSEDLVYTSVVPCRILDTRLTGGAMAGEEIRNYNSSGADFLAQGGAATDCGIPADAAVVVLNVTTVRPANGGYLTIYPYGATRPLASSLNFIVGADNGNEIMVKQTMGQSFDFSIYAYSPTNVVADIAGYFAAPVAGALACETVSGTPVVVASGTEFSVTATCSAGFGVTGGGNRSTGNGKLTVAQSHPSSSTSWTVGGRNQGGQSDSVTAVAQCCRIPGR